MGEPCLVEVGIGESGINVIASGITNLEEVPSCVFVAEEGVFWDLDCFRGGDANRGVAFPNLTIRFEDFVSDGGSRREIPGEVVVPMVGVTFENPGGAVGEVPDLHEGFLRRGSGPTEMEMVPDQVSDDRGDRNDAGLAGDFDFEAEVFGFFRSAGDGNGEEIGAGFENLFFGGK